MFLLLDKNLIKTQKKRRVSFVYRGCNVNKVVSQLLYSVHLLHVVLQRGKQCEVFVDHHSFSARAGPVRGITALYYDLKHISDQNSFIAMYLAVNLFSG